MNQRTLVQNQHFTWGSWGKGKDTGGGGGAAAPLLHLWRRTRRQPMTG